MSDFKTYRAVTKIHLGQIERDLYEGDLVEFNGQTVKIGGESFQLSSLRAAVSKNWLVDASDTTAKYVPQSANIGVRKASEAGEESSEKSVIKTVNDEEKVVGSSTKLKVENKDDNEDAVAIGKVKTASKQKSILKDGASVDAEITRLDNTALKASVVRREDQEVVAKSMSVDEAQAVLADAVEVAPAPAPAPSELDAVKGEVSEIKGQIESMMSMLSQMMMMTPSTPVAKAEKPATATTSVDDASEYQELMPDADVMGSNLLKTASEEGDESLEDGSLEDDFSDFFDGFDEGDFEDDFEDADEEFEEEPAYIDDDMEPVSLEETLEAEPNVEEASEGAPNSIDDERMMKLSNGEVWDMSRHYNTRASDLINNYLDNPLLNEILELEVKGVRKRVANAMGNAS